MARLRTLLMVIAAVTVSTVTVQAADLEIGPKVARPALYHHHHWRQWRAPGRCEFVEGVRGATPLTVPFFAYGWTPGPTYLVGWRNCHAAAEPAISVNY